MQAETGYYRDDVARWRQLLDKIIHRLEQLQREPPHGPGG
jgi:cell division septum initiation protein DivIVA